MTTETEKKLVEALEVHNGILLVIAKQLSLICQGDRLCREVSGHFIDDLEKWIVERERSKDEIPD